LRSIFLILLFLVVFPWQSFAQYEKYLQKDPEPTDQAQAGAAISIIEDGTGVGGFYERPIIKFLHVGATFNFFFLRDKNQIDFYDPYYQVPVTYGKKNNVYLLDLMFSLKQRLFSREIADNLRPFVSIGAGPVYGMNFPKNSSAPKQYRWAFNYAAALGVDMAMNGNYLFGLRLQYRRMKFNGMLGERQDHSTLDIRIELGKLL